MFYYGAEFLESSDQNGLLKKIDEEFRKVSICSIKKVPAPPGEYDSNLPGNLARATLISRLILTINYWLSCTHVIITKMSSCGFIGFRTTGCITWISVLKCLMYLNGPK